MATKTYDPAKVLVSFAGQVITGFAPDTFISAERNEDGFTLVVGAGGEATRSRSRNKSGTVTLTLMASSQSNDILSAVALADELSGTGVSPLFVKEFNGTTLVMAQNAWIKKLPTMERAKEAGTVEWVFECEAVDLLLGGLL